MDGGVIEEGCSLFGRVYPLEGVQYPLLKMHSKRISYLFRRDEMKFLDGLVMKGANV